MNRLPLLSSGVTNMLTSGRWGKSARLDLSAYWSVRYYTVLAKECAQLGSPRFIEKRWIRTVNLRSSQTRWLNSSRACWYFCFLSTREHCPFKFQAEASQNLSNISYFSLVNSNKSIFPHVFVQGEPSIKLLIFPALLLHRWTCAVVADPNTTSTRTCFPDSKTIHSGAQDRPMEVCQCSGKI